MNDFSLFYLDHSFANAAVAFCINRPLYGTFNFVRAQLVNKTLEAFVAASKPRIWAESTFPPFFFFRPSLRGL